MKTAFTSLLTNNNSKKLYNMPATTSSVLYRYDITTRPRVLSKLFVKADLLAQKERYTSKVMHSYCESKNMDDPQTDK